MPAHYVLKKTKNGEFMFDLLAGNGQVIFTSQVYKEKRGATTGIASVSRNAHTDALYERKIGHNGEGYFVLHARNKEVIGRSQMYKSKGAMEKGIASVRKNADAPTKDLTEATQTPAARA
jgi:uncharacterized protein YegP (UPF0339 family)